MPVSPQHRAIDSLADTVRRARTGARRKILPGISFSRTKDKRDAANSVLIPHFRRRAQELSDLGRGDAEAFRAHTDVCQAEKRWAFEQAKTREQLKDALALANILHHREGYDDRLKNTAAHFYPIMRSAFIGEEGSVITPATATIGATRASNVVEASQWIGLYIRDEPIPGTGSPSAADVEAPSREVRTAAIYNEYQGRVSGFQDQLTPLLRGMARPAHTGQARRLESVFLALMERIVHLQAHPDTLAVPSSDAPGAASTDATGSTEQLLPAQNQQVNPMDAALAQAIQHEYAHAPSAERRAMNLVVSAILGGSVTLEWPPAAANPSH